jgi:hypothetical protein
VLRREAGGYVGRRHVGAVAKPGTVLANYWFNLAASARARRSSTVGMSRVTRRIKLCRSSLTINPETPEACASGVDTLESTALSLCTSRTQLSHIATRELISASAAVVNLPRALLLPVRH